MGESGNDSFLNICNVSLAYGDGEDRLVALNHVSFSVDEGESVALIGPSGCGKSSMLHMIAGLHKPSAGSIRIAGAEVGQPRQETAFIPQDLGLFPWKTVLDNAMIGLQIRKTPGAEAHERARCALREVGLQDFESAYPRELSGGMRQRLALARALSLNADLLLMDEPLSAIDALLRETLQDTLIALWRQRGYSQVVVTHSIEEAVLLGQRILVFTPRPGTLAHIIGNPQAGDAAYRSTEEFAATCKAVREALAASADGGAEVES